MARAVHVRERGELQLVVDTGSGRGRALAFDRRLNKLRDPSLTNDVVGSDFAATRLLNETGYVCGVTGFLSRAASCASLFQPRQFDLVVLEPRQRAFGVVNVWCGFKIQR